MVVVDVFEAALAKPVKDVVFVVLSIDSTVVTLGGALVVVVVSGRSEVVFPLARILGALVGETFEAIVVVVMGSVVLVTLGLMAVVLISLGLPLGLMVLVSIAMPLGLVVVVVVVVVVVASLLGRVEFVST